MKGDRGEKGDKGIRGRQVRTPADAACLSQFRIVLVIFRVLLAIVEERGPPGFPGRVGESMIWVH